MRTIRIVCDVCHDPSRATTKYKVTVGTRTASTNRCAEHAAVFEHVFECAGKVRGRDGRQRVTTLEEIERMKAKSA